MFQAIEALVRSAGRLTLSIKMDGERMVVFMTPQAEGADGSLRQPLILSASAAELDEGFAEAVLSYTAVHRTLNEQVAATTAILQAAEQSHASKAHKALSGPKLKPAVSDEGDDEEGADAPPAQSAPVSPPAKDGNDLLSLLI